MGVLVAISIPIFTAQLEKAREATDLANIRSAYAECTMAVLTGEADDNVTPGADGSYSKDVDITQTKAGWLDSNQDVKLAGKAISTFTWKPVDGSDGTVTVTVNKDGTFDVTKKGRLIVQALDYYYKQITLKALRSNPEGLFISRVITRACPSLVMTLGYCAE